MISLILSLLLLHSSRSQNDKTFVCEDGNTIEFEKTCDGIKHCDDGSDELPKLCFHIICPTNNFRCFYGACVEKHSKCDGTVNCVDHSDESQCGIERGSCEKHQFKCTTGECISLNSICDGTEDCEDKSDEELCHKISCPADTFRCKVGGCIHKEQLCDGQNDCIDGSDEAELLCENVNCKEKCDAAAHCPSIDSSRIISNCEVPSGPSKGVISCNKSLPAGTIVQYECKPYYIPSDEYQVDNKEMVCQVDGRWNKETLKCKPDCGVAQLEVSKLIVHGWYPETGQFPWHTTLFTLEEGTWQFTCGGTLISEKIVLTAAHCTWKIPRDMLQVGLGKLFSDYYKTEDYAQIIKIAHIIQHPLYQDILGNYGSDIAILVLEEPVEFSAVVRPACIDWALDDITDHLKKNSLGMIAGMGVTENDTWSQQLRATHLPVISDEGCINEQNRDFKKYITFTSFCAGWMNGTGVCNGDSGGGLVFPLQKDPNRYTLQGIVSVSPRRLGTSFCNPKFYTVFTKVGMYVDWIKKELKGINEEIH